MGWTKRFISGVILAKSAGLPVVKPPSSANSSASFGEVLEMLEVKACTPHAR